MTPTPQLNTVQENYKLFKSFFPEFSVPPNLGQDLHLEGGLLLSLIELAYSIGKNRVALIKENENNTAEIYDEASDRCYFGGSPKSLVAALLIVILNYKLNINYE